MRIYSLVVLLIMPGFILKDGGCGQNDLPLTKESLIRINARYMPTRYSSTSYEGYYDSIYDFNSEAVRMRGGWRDTLLVGDILESQHGINMRDVLIGMGIPETSLSFSLNNWGSILEGNRGLSEFTSGRYESLRRRTRVVHVPLSTPFATDLDVERLRKESNTLFVTTTGNSYSYERIDRINSPTSRPWDIWSNNHLLWQADGYWRVGSTAERNQKVYQNNLEIARLGNVIFASSANVSSDSMTVVPHRNVIRCGTLKDACFTIIPRQSTSRASARLSAMTFYLAQFWDTPQEIVSVLKECAIDAGEPGPDIEYGLGIANLLCGPVLQKEMEAVFAQNPAPAARSVGNLVNALGDHPQFTKFAAAMFSVQ